MKAGMKKTTERVAWNISVRWRRCVVQIRAGTYDNFLVEKMLSVWSAADEVGSEAHDNHSTRPLQCASCQLKRA